MPAARVSGLCLVFKAQAENKYFLHPPPTTPRRGDTSCIAPPIFFWRKLKSTGNRFSVALAGLVHTISVIFLDLMSPCPIIMSDLAAWRWIYHCRAVDHSSRSIYTHGAPNRFVHLNPKYRITESKRPMYHSRSIFRSSKRFYRLLEDFIAQPRCARVRTHKLRSLLRRLTDYGLYTYLRVSTCDLRLRELNSWLDMSLKINTNMLTLAMRDYAETSLHGNARLTATRHYQKVKQRRGIRGSRVIFYTRSGGRNDINPPHT